MLKLYIIIDYFETLPNFPVTYRPRCSEMAIYYAQLPNCLENTHIRNFPYILSLIIMSVQVQRDYCRIIDVCV